nr:hypothetical protein [Tanacetum cinerariifolium]
DINQGRGLQLSQDIEDSHVTLTPVKPDGQQESSSASSQFVTSMLNPTSDVGVESIFATASSSVAPLPTPTPTPIMTPSIITTIKTASHPPIPPTPISSEVLQNLPTFDLVFRFDERLKSLEANFSETLHWIRPGSKRQREGKEAESASALLKPATRSAGRSTTGSKSRQASASESTFVEEPVQTTSQIEESSHPVFETGAEDQLIVQSSQHTEWFSQPKKPPTSDHYGHIKWIEDLVPRTMWIQEPINYDKHALWGVSHWGWKRQQFYGFAVNRESALDVYSKRRIIAVTDLKIMEWHNYKHRDWISVRRDDDKIYKFKEGDFKRLRLQDIEDMLLLLVQGKLSNMTVEERFAFNVSLRMFTRSIVIQQRVEDLQLGVESYQKRLNLTKLDTYQSDLKRQEAYTAYSNPRGFIYQNKNKKNRLIRIDKLHKFNDGTLNDVCNALDDLLKGIRMQYLPQTIWRKGDKDRAAAMIQAIDKMLKTRRIMRSLERFVGGRLYEGDFRMLQRTI